MAMMQKAPKGRPICGYATSAVGSETDSKAFAFSLLSTKPTTKVSSMTKTEVLMMPTAMNPRMRSALDDS